MINLINLKDRLFYQLQKMTYLIKCVYAVFNGHLSYPEFCAILAMIKKYYFSKSIRNPAPTQQHNYQLLVIDYDIPKINHDAGSNYIIELLKIVITINIDVTLILINHPFYDPKKNAVFKKLGIKCICWPEYINIDQYLQREGHQFKWVMINKISCAQQCFKKVKYYLPNAIIVFLTVDLHFLRNQREAELLKSNKLLTNAAQDKVIELDIIKKSDVSIVVSTEEYCILKKYLPNANVAIIPIPHSIYGNTTAFEQRNDILFIGSFLHKPNLDGIEFFIREIWPIVRNLIPDVRLHIIGSHTPKKIFRYRNNHIIVHGYVENLLDIYQSIRINIAPLRYGAGIKGKIISSLAHGVPTVATTIATEGMGLIHDKHALIADSPDDFANAIAELYQNKNQWEKISNHGLTLAENQFSTTVITQKMKQLFSQYCTFPS